MENIESIIEASDAIMVARRSGSGDTGTGSTDYPKKDNKKMPEFRRSGYNSYTDAIL